MDTETVIGLFLQGATGYPAYLEKPGLDLDDRGEAVPDEYIVVTQTGGGANMFDQVRFDVDCYAPKKQRKRAKATALAVCAAICDLDEDENLFQPEVENMYRQNDPDTGEARYIVQGTVYACDQI